MGIRTAGSGGMTVRWACAALLVLSVALAVLIHHEIPGSANSSMSGSGHAAHAGMRMQDGLRMADSMHRGVHMTKPAVSEPSAHSTGLGSCGTPGMHHCMAAAVDAVQLDAPGRTGIDPFPQLHRAAATDAPAGTADRAPPDLSVLSQLRI